MDSSIYAYIAGLLDGSGNISFQLIRKKDDIYGYQVHSSISFYKRSENGFILEWLNSVLDCGYIHHRDGGVSDYTIVESSEVRRVLKLIEPHIRIKIGQVRLGLEILDALEKVDGAESFLELCQLVDRFRGLCSSKKKTTSSEEVRQHLQQTSFFQNPLV